MKTSFPLLFFASAAAFLLTGCGDDRPYSGPSPGSGAVAQAPALSSTPSRLTVTAPAAASGPAGGNPLLPQGGPPDNPLLPPSGNPLTQRNPLLSGNPLRGPVMPTDHSHWLNTEFDQAQVSVLLNGIRLSSFQPSGTQDITMKLRPGPNTLTVVYTPRNVHSWGSVTVTEGEHDGHAILLAAFQKAPVADSGVSDLTSDASSDMSSDASPGIKPTMQTFTFFAK